MQSECDLKAREYYHFHALKYAICDGSNAAHIQECFQSLKDYRARIAHTKSMELRKLFECLPQEVKRQRYDFTLAYDLIDDISDHELFDMDFSGSLYICEPITLESYHSEMRKFTPFRCESHVTTDELIECVIFRTEDRWPIRYPIPYTLLPFIFPTFIPLMEVVTFPRAYQTVSRFASFQASEFCSRVHAINGFDLTLRSNKLHKCTHEWIERTLTHPTRFLRLSFFTQDLYNKDMDRIIEHCVHITKPRSLRISLLLDRYNKVPVSVNITPLLHVLMRIITNWPCDVQLIVGSCFDLDSVWLASCLNLSPHYPFRITLKHIHPTLLHSKEDYTLNLVGVNLANKCLRREIKLHALRLHCASKLFPFGQLPYDGPMETTTQCFSACAYYNRHLPGVSAYLGGEFPQRPIQFTLNHSSLNF